jgi:hypothetical protein
MSRNIALKFEYYTGKPSRRVKRTSNVELCQTPSEVTDKILGVYNRNLLRPILDNYYNWIRSVWSKDDAEEYIAKCDKHIRFYLEIMKAEPRWGAQ